MIAVDEGLGEDTDVGGLVAVPDGDATLVRLWGSVDEALRAEASVAMAVALGRTGPVRIDTSGVEFLDSAGLAFILQLVRACKEDGREVRLVDPAPQLIELLDILELRGQVPLEFSRR